MKEESNVQAPPPSLVRRRTEGRDNVMSTPAPDREKDVGLRQGSLDTSTALASTPSRSVTVGPGPTTLAQSSPWTNAGSTFSPMGSFGNLGSTDPLGHPSTPADRKPGLGSTRSTSRWSKIINRGPPDDHGVTEKLSVGNLGKLSEVDAESSPRDWSETRVNRPLSNETDPYGDRDRPEGPPALGGMLEMAPSQLRQTSRMSTPGAPESKDSLGLADVTTNPSLLTGLREVLSDRSNQAPLRAPPPPPPVYGDGEPLSPTETNPYQSPVPEKADPDDVDTDDSDVRHVQHPGLNNRVPNDNHYPAASEMEAMSQMPTSFDHPPSERAPAYRATPDHLFTTGLSTMGGMPRPGGPAGWPTGSALLNGPGSEQAPFGSEYGSPVYHAVNELQQSTFVAPPTGLPGSAYDDGDAGTRGGRLGSMFPPAMYTPQMPGGETIKSAYDLETSHHLHGLPPRSTAADQQQQQQQQQQPPNRMASGNYGSAFSLTGQDPGSPMRATRGLFDTLLPSNVDNTRHRSSTDRPLTGSDSSVRVSTSASGQEPLSTLLAASSNTAVASAAVPSNNNNNNNNNINTPSQPSARASQVTTGAPQPAAHPPLPPPQQRIMVMPDRMRWIYRDPQGAVQGPWSGLEMHDWFKAGFFSAELLVRKFEDAEFEPLGQLIRRIGNSREPFLVPQIGIPHGSPSNQTGGPWNNGAGTSAHNQKSPAGPVQPPFAGAFPSFGTTLTAEQQNALERRKQEEQFLMARQKEYLAQQQLLQKQMQQIHGVHQPLHHHSSAHSLHSQPSFGSMTSPSAFHPTPPQGPIQPPQSVPNFFDNHARLGGPAFLGPMGPGNDFAGTGPGSIRDEELADLLARQGLGRDGPPPHGFSTSSTFHQQHPENQGHPSQVAAMIAQRAQLQREQAKHDSMLVPSSDEQQAPNYRLQEFNQLRAHLEEDHVRRDDGNIGESLDHSTAQADTTENYQRSLQQPAGYSLAARPEDKTNVTKKVAPRDTVPFSAAKQQQQQQQQQYQHQHQQTPEVLSLTQQVQKAASEQQQPTISSRPDSGWGRRETPGLPRPFPPAPPPQSISPLPAPAAQRKRQQLPEALTIEQARLRSQTSSVETPSAISSIAPWAKEVSDGPKGPSLKEIQEAEARKAAKAEEMALAARRTFLEQERERLSQQATANTALLQGLPPSSTWGSGTPPLTPTGVGPSAWVKPLTTKINVESSTKKTLSQIQAEEEARKQKAAGATNTVNPASSNVVSGVPGVTTGKRYADLASKAAPPSAVGTGGGAWTTVGATGKAKAQPQSSVGPVSGTTGVASAGSTGSGNAIGSKARASIQAPRSSAVIGGVSTVHNAQEEFSRWAKVTLAKGLDSNINGRYFDGKSRYLFPVEHKSNRLANEECDLQWMTLCSNYSCSQRKRKLSRKACTPTLKPWMDVNSPSSSYVVVSRPRRELVTHPLPTIAIPSIIILLLSPLLVEVVFWL